MGWGVLHSSQWNEGYGGKYRGVGCSAPSIPQGKDGYGGNRDVWVVHTQPYSSCILFQPPTQESWGTSDPFPLQVGGAWRAGVRTPLASRAGGKPWGGPAQPLSAQRERVVGEGSIWGWGLRTVEGLLREDAHLPSPPGPR